MSSSEYPNYYDFLKKITANRGLVRDDLKNLVQGQTIFLVIDGNHSHRPTLFEFVYMSQYCNENDVFRSIILKAMKSDLSREVEINTSDFSVERLSADHPLNLRRLFLDPIEARKWFEDVSYVYDVQNEEKINTTTYFSIYNPNKKMTGPEQPPAPDVT
jgi:hypothetical protein